MNENGTVQIKSSQDLVCVAAIAGAFGIKGEVKLKSFMENPEDCLSFGPLLNDMGEVILTPKSFRPVKKFLAVKVVEIQTREQAEALKSTKLYVPKDVLPEPDEDEFFYSDLIGMRVKNTKGQFEGTVKAVHDFGAGDMLEIKPKQGASWYHPFTKKAVPKVNMKTGLVVIEVIEADVVKPRDEEE